MTKVNPIRLSAHNPSPMTGDGNNTYLLVGPDRSATLIDAGVGEPQHLDELATALGAHGARLDAVLVTHGHADHAAGAPRIAAAQPSAVFRKRPWPEEDARYPVTWLPLDDGELVGTGEQALTVLHTPGHSPDHVAFWHPPSRTIFTGDLVALGSSVMIHWSRGGDLGQYLASLERLLALDAQRLLPAHGPQIDDPRAVLQGYLAHRRQREEQVIAALRAGRTTVEAIAESIYDGLAAALVPAARENVRAHLEKLRIDGRAAHDAGRWTL
jgi:glyoxylase-like metal-dependent hydrolase (beta-lactamase superfamily II)